MNPKDIQKPDALKIIKSKINRMKEKTWKKNQKKNRNFDKHFY